MKSRVHPTYKTKYHVQNWAAYDRALVCRGDITIWLSPAALAAWEPDGAGTRGAQRKYSDLAIESALTLRLLFHLPLRQTEGFLTSLFVLMGLDLRSPDHTTLSRGVVAQIKCEVERDPDETGGMKSRVHPKYKTKYRVRNWASYERALIGRGNIAIWLSRAAIAAWRPEGTRTRGAPPKYSDLAIETALTLRLLFHLPLRQAEGFLTSRFHLMGLDLRSPDHTTLSRRGQHLNLTLRRVPRRAALHLCIDSTGLSMVGEGEVGGGETRTTRAAWVEEAASGSRPSRSDRRSGVDRCRGG